MSFKLTMNADKVAAQLQQRASQLVRATTLGIEARAKINAPKDTGFMANSTQADPSFQAGDLSDTVGVGAEYGHFVEWGTSRTAPQPFFTQAFEDEKPEFEKGLRDLLK
jgi:HK97 gp10 family phage protein